MSKKEKVKRFLRIITFPFNYFFYLYLKNKKIKEYQKIEMMDSKFIH